MVNLTSEYEEELPQQHFHYDRLQRLVRETIPQIKIKSIRQVHNKYLSLAFTVRENEMRRRNGVPSTITEYIHATGESKIASILRGNLDWRLVRRSKYGHGVSFSHDASYANKYCNNRNGWNRAFVFCDILEGNIEDVYDNGDTHPPQNIDSYQSTTGCVLVKFDDFTFNPKFVVYYEEGGYDTDCLLYNDVYFGQHDYNNSSILDQEYNYEQYVLLKQILRIPLKNEDFLNEIVAENNKCTRTIVQPRPIELPNQTPVIPKDSLRIEEDARKLVTPKDSERTEVDVSRPIRKDSERIEIDAGRPELPSVEDHKGMRQIIPTGVNIEATLRPTVLNIIREGYDSRNGAYSRRQFEEPTTPPIRKCVKYSLILLLVVLIVCIGIFYNLFSG